VAAKIIRKLPMAETNLNRFLTAQQPVYDKVIEELKNGKKITHWMWFIFPQIQGLGKSDNAKYFSISNISEANAYLLHPILGKRLIECTTLVLQIQNKTAVEIFGDTDATKLKSCMTLFNAATPRLELFRKILDKYFDGLSDVKTQELLSE
jgi:uncharacterized protein (DUF1810 family)